MGRRLIWMLALTALVGTVVRLAPAQDGAATTPPAETPSPPSELPPADTFPPPGGDVLPPPPTVPMPAAKDAERGGPSSKAAPNASKPVKPATPPAAADPAAAPAVPPEPGGPLVPLDPVGGPATTGEGSPLTPAQPLAPASALDQDVEKSQVQPQGGAVPDGSQLPPATEVPGQPRPSVAANEGDEYILPPERLQLGRQSAGLSVEVVGPPRLNLNTTATYRIVVRNDGTADAAGVVVRDRLPEGLAYESSQPEAQRGPESILVWNLGTIPGNTQQSIVVKVKPTRVGEVDHAATVSMRAGAKTRTQVYEPKLKVEQVPVTGKFLKGKPVQFKISVTNFGNGTARNVLVRAALSAGLRADLAEGDENSLFELPLGDLPPGERIVLDPLVVDTVSGGDQTCTVTATSPDVSPGDEAAKNVQTVTVIQPGLEMRLVGPGKRFTDTVSTYTITLENPGTATARNVRALATLPIGGRLIKSTPQAKFDATTRRLQWGPLQLEPGGKDRTQLTFDVRMGGPGVYQVTAEAVGDLGLKENKEVRTQVEAIADLEIQITEDRRVVDVGQTTMMKVTITNRGSKDATKLLVSGRHSPNLKVTRTAGTDSKAESSPNEPTFFFPEIKRLAKGASLVLGIEVEAQKEGPASCKIFLKHEDDELSQEDFAAFRVTTHQAAH